MNNAGYKIIKAECYGKTKEHCYYVVLGKKDSDYGTQYVTWESTDLTSFYWGHYINNDIVAKKDYHQRLLNLYENPPFTITF